MATNPILDGPTACVLCAHRRMPGQAVGRSPCDLFRERSAREAREACKGERFEAARP